jgi:hypothetical protein
MHGSLVDTNVLEKNATSIFRAGEYNPVHLAPKRWYLSTRLHDLTFQNKETFAE